MRRLTGSILLLLIGLVLLSGCGRSAARAQGAATPTEEVTPTGGAVDNSPAPIQLAGTGLVGLTPLPEGGYRLSIRGFTQPYLRLEDGALVVDLPGLELAEGISLPPAVTAELVAPEAVIDARAGTNGLDATIPTRMPRGGVRLTLPAPTGPYALYRVDGSTIDLRFHAPGLAGKVIVIDPGHGAEETGAIGPGGYPEKDVNLAVGLLLRPMLEAAGVEVIMTRTEDTRSVQPGAGGSPFAEATSLRNDLMARANISNRAGADLFLSIHANGGPADMGGIETFWAIRNLNASRSQELGWLVQEEMLEAYGWVNRGTKQRGFNVIRNSEAPAVLAELGFLTLPQEGQVLITQWGQEQGALALYRAIARFFAGE